MSCKSFFFTLLAELWRIASNIFILTSSYLLFVCVLHFWYSGHAQQLADHLAAFANEGLLSLGLAIVELRSAMRDTPDPGLLSKLLNFVTR